MLNGDNSLEILPLTGTVNNNMNNHSEEIGSTAPSQVRLAQHRLSPDRAFPSAVEMAQRRLSFKFGDVLFDTQSHEWPLAFFAASLPEIQMLHIHSCDIPLTATPGAHSLSL